MPLKPQRVDINDPNTPDLHGLAHYFEDTEFTLKQAMYIVHFCTDCNYNHAASLRAAGFAPNDTSIRNNKEIRQLCLTILSEQCASPEEAMARHNVYRNATVYDFMDENGKITASSLKTARAKQHASAIKKIKNKTYIDAEGKEVIECELELHDGMAANTALLKAMGRLTEKVDVDVHTTSVNAHLFAQLLPEELQRAINAESIVGRILQPEPAIQGSRVGSLPGGPDLLDQQVVLDTCAAGDGREREDSAI